jgi:uncharacterized protein
MSNHIDDNSVPDVMTDDQAWEFLASEQVGRVAISVGGSLDIYPITYAVDHKTLVLLELSVDEHVAFEIDHFDQTSARSVVVHGTTQRLETTAEIAAAEALDLPSIIALSRTRYVRITPTEVTGRNFTRA